ncbi:Miniconductance mechanosensitive channel YbdG [Planctomycetes bacterium CA13]|uniref:Miniconductance mechanosensitive channel YbdG n=1 Tax=Novipirellula herctigrandis TaxID=2527986 RepID=A0A5C5ZCS7_9BACT|nr:Miniconductance mechanosensitive channel YbdG [Planctomycetes bacterium CA13]
MLEIIQQSQATLRDWLRLPDNFAAIIVPIANVAVVLIFAVIIDRVARWCIRSLVPWIVSHFKSEKPTIWLTALRERLVASRSAHILAVSVVYWLVPLALDGFPETLTLVRNLIEGYMIIIVVIAINSLIRASGDVLVNDDLPTGVSLRFATQGVQIVIAVVGAILVASVVFDTSVTVLLSGMAGMTAVLLLVFKDTILGFVAGIQLASNDMLRIDDWIEIPQYGADGVVTDIGLTTVKIQNFDKTFSTIPSYALVSESFRNWRGMKESGARRILRSVSIDMNGIGFLTEEQFHRLRNIALLERYLDDKRDAIEKYNLQFTDAQLCSPNIRRLTNIGTLRAYLERYLKQHPDLRDDMSVIVQHQQSSAEGLPIQIVAFCRKQDACDYERVQAEIFDHIIAILPEFGLTAFQGPTDELKKHMPIDR